MFSYIFFFYLNEQKIWSQKVSKFHRSRIAVLCIFRVSLFCIMNSKIWFFKLGRLIFVCYCFCAHQSTFLMFSILLFKLASGMFFFLFVDSSYSSLTLIFTEQLWIRFWNQFVVLNAYSKSYYSREKLSEKTAY